MSCNECLNKHELLKMLTPRQAAVRLKVNPVRVYQLIRVRELLALDTPVGYLIHPNDIARYLENKAGEHVAKMERRRLAFAEDKRDRRLEQKPLDEVYIPADEVTVEDLTSWLALRKNRPADVERMAKILWCRFCVPVPCRLSELATEWGVTRERIRQIEAKGIRLLRYPRTRGERIAADTELLLGTTLGSELAL